MLLNPMVCSIPAMRREATDRLLGAFAVGTINDEERQDVVRHACPGAGACGGMYT